MERAHLEIDLLTLLMTRKWMHRHIRLRYGSLEVMEGQFWNSAWRNSSNSMKPSPLSSKTLKTKLKRMKFISGLLGQNASIRPPSTFTGCMDLCVRPSDFKETWLTQKSPENLSVIFKLTLQMKSGLLLEKTLSCFHINFKEFATEWWW